MDLNHGRLSPTDLQSVAIDRSAIPPHLFHLRSRNALTGAGKGIRTSDLLITSQLLYRLSYTGFNKLDILHYIAFSVKHLPSSNASVCSEMLILHSDSSSMPPLTVPKSFRPTL